MYYDKYIFYRHTTPDNMFYIGITNNEDVDKRFGKNGCGYRENLLFTEAIKYWGWDNILHEKLGYLTIEDIEINLNIRLENRTINETMQEIKGIYCKKLITKVHEIEDELIYNHKSLNPRCGFNKVTNRGERFIWTMEKQNSFMEDYINGDLSEFMYYIMTKDNWRVILDWSNNLNYKETKTDFQIARAYDERISNYKDIEEYIKPELLYHVFD